MHLERIEHTLAGDDDLLGLLLHGQRAHQRRHLLRRLPLGELPQALLPGPHAGVDNLQKELPGARVEDENRAVDRLRGQVTLERLVDRHPVHVGIVHEPDRLVAEQLAVVLRVEVRLRGLRRVQLKTLTHSLPQHVQRRVSLHDLSHRLLDQGLAPGEPVTVRRVQVIRQVDADHDPGRGRVDGHVIRGVVEKLSSGVPLDVVRVKVAPSKLHVDPELVGRFLVERILRVAHQGRFGYRPLVRGEEEDIRARRVHLVRFPRVNRLLLNRLNLQRVELLVKHLAQVHGDGLVDLLPEMRAEDLDEGDLERGNLAVHEDAGEVELHLEAHVDVGSVDRR